jgi:PAS domain S-box-containing protein
MVDKASYEALKIRVAELEAENQRWIKVENELQYRLDFENIITTISSKFVKLPFEEIDSAIQNALKRIGEFTQVDRGYIYRYGSADSAMNKTHEWCASGVPSHIKNFHEESLNWNSWLVAQITAAKVVHVPDVEKLPLEADSLKRKCRIEKVKSLIWVPTEYAGSVIGFLGLDAIREAKTWSKDVISLLRIVGEIFVNALERKRVEEALRQSEEKYRTILESVEDGYWEVDLKGNFLYFSPSVCQLLGYSQEELMGLNYRDYVTDDVARSMYQIFSSIFKTGKSAQVMEFEHIIKDKKRIVVEMSISLMRDDDGNPIGFRGVSRDVTYRRKADQALRLSEQRYRTVLEANPDPMAVSDINGRVSFFNPAFTKIFGWELEEFVGKEMSNLFPGQNTSEAKLKIRRMLAGKGGVGVETRFTLKDGNIIPVSVSGAVYNDVDGNPMGSILTIRDISDKKKMVAQLLNLHKMESLGTLAGGIAHDFNNLLMSIQGNLSLVLYELEEDHPHYKLLESIEKNVESGSRLTAQLLGFARKGTYAFKPLDLNTLLQNVVETFGRTRKEISITLDVAEDLAAIEADEGQIEQVLLNLLVNAGHAMPDGGEIRLITRNITYDDIVSNLYQPKPGHYVMLSVTDTGTGIDKEVLPHIFEPFFTTKEAGQGTGLGLASVYGIVKGHNGYIDVDSEKGRGTTFFIYLPASDQTLQQNTDIDEKKVVAGKGTILFVDDEDMVLDVAAKMLEVAGYNVLTANNGKTAIEIYKANQARIDLVILDVIMPVMNGGQIFDRIKEINPDVKVLLSSGYNTDGNIREIIQRGCSGFIQKPFNVKTISSKIREILEPPS